jgi:hypothetical protein
MAKKMPDANYLKRSEELMRPIDRQIMMCDNVEDVLMLASNMLITAKNIYIQRIGGQHAKKLLSELVNEIDERILPVGGKIPPINGK